MQFIRHPGLGGIGQAVAPADGFHDQVAGHVGDHGRLFGRGVKADDFAIIKGEMAIYQSSPGVRRGFCGTCGTSLTYAGDDWDDPAVLSATLADPAIATPTSNVYLDHQQPWVVLDDTLKPYGTFPD